MSEGFNLRVKYKKGGRLAYLSHLETIRSMERVIRRAQLPYAITEGFNPHMKVAFGPALPVGAGGCGEYLDVRLREYVPAGTALEKLVEASAPHLRPVACEYIDVRANAISVEYPLSEWEAVFAPLKAEETIRLLQTLEDAFARLLQRGYIEVIGKKKKPKRVEFERRLVVPPAFVRRGEHVVCTFRTCDTGQGALRPDKFVDAALQGCSPRPQLVKLTRLELLQEEPAAE